MKVQANTSLGRLNAMQPQLDAFGLWPIKVGCDLLNKLRSYMNIIQF